MNLSALWAPPLEGEGNLALLQHSKFPAQYSLVISSSQIPFDLGGFVLFKTFLNVVT